MTGGDSATPRNDVADTDRQRFDIPDTLLRRIEALEALGSVDETHRAEKVSLIDEARSAGATWAAISAALGSSSRQAAQNWRARQPEPMAQQKEGKQ